MSLTGDSFHSTSTEDSSEQGVDAKLRKLKIQEGLCLKNVNKVKLREDCGDIELPVLYSCELKHFNTRVKNAISEINDLFEDIKAQTEEKLTGLDIDSMKKDVMNLDDKIRMFKNHLQCELATLASVLSQEEELNRQAVTEVEEKRRTSNFKSKMKSKPFNNIVPSPVKVLIKSPFKCKEVQEFQEFMMNSPNRYGGWNEYHHNLFVKIWQKYYTSDIEAGNTSTADAFQMEILHKIAGSTKDDIIRHQDWYSKYLDLKQQQQNALDKWKNSKRGLGKAQNEFQGCKKRWLDKRKSFNLNIADHNDNKGLLDLDITQTSIDTDFTGVLYDMGLKTGDEEIVSSGEVTPTSHQSSNNGKYKQRKRSLTNVLKPTEQWSNRCNSSKSSVNGMCNIECVTKLRIPNWRLALQD